MSATCLTALPTTPSATSSSTLSMKRSSTMTTTTTTTTRTQQQNNRAGNTPKRDTRVYMGRKAAKVAQTKNKNDAIRTKLYGKFGKEIARAAKEGGTGTDNVRLQGILKDAKRMSVPADLIERNLKKAGEAKGGDFMELTYECYGHGGVGIVMEVLSDNVNRCAGDIPAAVKKGGGKMAESGSVLFNFERKGLVYLKSGDEDAIFEAAIEAGADDVKENDEFSEDGYVVIAEYQSFASVRDSLIDGGFDVDAENSGLKLLPLANVEVSEEDAEANEVLLDKILEIEDVDAVFTQMDTIL
ncbi:unnamed protein product [Bathycoccus prasinos]